MSRFYHSISNLQEPQLNRNATANYVNLIRTSTVALIIAEWYVLPMLCKFFEGVIQTDGHIMIRLRHKKVSICKEYLEL